jgi:2-polyprenyl-6-methoxyphenol hydroxylase-like FAD-dependent oxidoreductase
MLQKVPADHFHANCKVVAADLSDPSSAAVIELESGERIAGHLIVAADGMNSTLRHQLLPKCQPTYAGYLAWRGVARVDELSGEVQHLLAGKTTMYKVSLCVCVSRERGVWGLLLGVVVVVMG